MTRTHRRTTDERLYAAAPEPFTADGALAAPAAADDAVACHPITCGGPPSGSRMTGAQASIQENTMSKGQRGNKEAKKPKKAPQPAQLPGPGAVQPAAAAPQDPVRRRK
jgi:hypothetical protein